MFFAIQALRMLLNKLHKIFDTKLNIDKCSNMTNKDTDSSLLKLNF